MKHRRKICLSICCVVTIVGIVLAVWIARRMVHTPARRALPYSASQIREHKIDLFVDYVYLMKADITSKQFDNFVLQMSMTKPSTSESWNSWDLKVPSWWNPPTSPAVIYIREVEDDTQQATYHNGSIFFQAWSE